MKDQYKTKKQLIEELEVLRNQFVKPEKTEANHRRTEQALRESQERFKIAAQSTSDLIWDWDIPTDRLEWFGPIDELLAYMPGKFPRTIEAWEKIIHPDDHDRVMATLDQHLKGQKPYDEEYRVRRKDGIYRYWTDRGVCLRDKEGNPYKMVGACTDITERKRAEEILKESESRFRNIMESSKDGIIFFDSKTQKILFGNSAMAELLGCSKGDLVGRTIPSLHPSEEWESIEQEFQKHVSGEISLSTGIPVLRNDGSVFYADISSSLITLDGRSYFSAFFHDITEREHAEEALRKCAEQYHIITNTPIVGFAVVDLDANFLDVNETYCQMTGYSRNEMLKMSVADMEAMEKPNEIRRRKQKVIETGSDRFESCHRHKEGRIIDVEISIAFVRQSACFLVFLHDITERKRTEKALRESEEKYRDLVENINDIIYAADEQGIITYVAPAIESFSGYTLPEIIGRPFFDFVYQEDMPDAVKYFQQDLSVQAEPHEFRMVTKTGNVRWVRVSSRPIFKDNHIIGVRGILTDITERKQIEEEYRTILRTAIDGFVIRDIQGRLLYVNDAYCHLVGYSRDELLIMNISDLETIERPDETSRRIQKIRETGGDRFETRLRCKDGGIVDVEVSISYIEIGGGRMFISIHNITDRKRTVEALRESEERFRKVVETMKVGLATVDENGVLTYVNEYSSSMIGYTMDEMVGHIPTEFYYDEEQRKAQEEIFKKRRMGIRDAPTHEVAWRAKDGRKVYSILSPTPSFDTHGRYTGSFAIHTDITERKQMETALRESEERFRRLVETMKVGLGAIDEKGVLTYVNEYFSKMLGYTIDEMIGRSTLDFYYDEESRKTQEEIFANRRVGMRDPTPYEVTWRKKNGQKVYSILSPTPSFDTHGRYTGSFAIHTDITERKRAEEALRESEERFRLAFENANTGVCLVDLEGNLTKVNNKMCEIFGYTKEELEHMTVNDIAHSEDINKSPAFIQRTLRGETDRGTFEKRYIHKKGHVVTCQVSSSLVRNADGYPLYFISHVHDITERKQAEELLQKERETSLSILENAPYGVALIGKGGHYIYINPEFTNMTGYTLQDIPTGKDWYQKAFPDQRERERAIQVWKEDRSKEKMMDREFGIHCKDGKIKEIEIRVNFLKNGHALIVLRDITEQKLSQEKMESLREQLRQSQKMEAIGRLAGGVAHDFNNLLTIIKGYSQLSLIELKEDSLLKKNIEHIHTATDRAANLVRQLLAFSRRQILEMKVLDLNAILATLDNMLRRVIGEDIELTTILAEDLGRVKSDPGWIEQAIMNLVVNSRDAMPSGGKLTIETGNADLDEASTYGHVGVEPGRYVMLSVSDTGVGITPEVMERLFEPFFSTKEKDKGTGLGLSTVYGIVKQSDGDIWVYSEPGKGATFKIYLPRVDEPLEERREKVLGDELLRGSETILLVEDEENVRKLALRVLERQGYKVLSACDGDDALLICEQFKDPIHLMLTDVVMPRMSGHELAKRLKSLHPKMKVLYMSGYTDDTIVLHGVLVEGVNYIQKPFTVDALTKKVREVLDQ
jgi:two-component system cell cycle sensor histidine kinase/response regulator CckA